MMMMMMTLLTLAFAVQHQAAVDPVVVADASGALHDSPRCY